MGNEGARQLSNVDASLRVIAEKLNVSREMVRQWRAGKKLPAAENRDALFQAFGIPVEAWDRAPGSEDKGKAKKAARKSPEAPKKASQDEAKPSSATEPEDVVSMLRSQLAALDDLEAGQALSDTARLKLISERTKILREIAKITGEYSDISEDTIVRHPAFRRVLEAIVQAVEACPKCVIAVDEALAKLE